MVKHSLFLYNETFEEIYTLNVFSGETSLAYTFKKFIKKKKMEHVRYSFILCAM